MNRQNKAQAALEFLMTYGWAILVVLVVIAALAYFGVLSPSQLLPEKCTFAIGLSCTDFTVGDSDLTVALRNSGSRAMNVEEVTASSQALGNGDLGEGCATEVEGYPVALQPAQSAEFLMDIPPEGSTCDYLDTGRAVNKYNLTVYYDWQDSPDIIHYAYGEILARKK